MRLIKILVILLLTSATMLSCAARKKRKCNTCPKWTQVTPIQDNATSVHDIG